MDLLKSLCPESSENIPILLQEADLCFSNQNDLRNPKMGSNNQLQAINHQEPLKKVFFSDSAHKVIFFQKRKKNRHALQCKQSCRKKSMPSKLKGLFFKHFYLHNMKRYNFFQVCTDFWRNLSS